MKLMNFTVGDDGTITAIAKGDSPCIASISNIRFHDTESLLHMDVDWVSNGKYTNGQRKKLLARTMVRLLRAVVANAKKTLNTHKD